MLKKIAAAALMACLVPAAALACDGVTTAEQRQVAPVSSAKKQLLIAQKIDMKDLQKAGNDAAASIQKDANKVDLNKNLQNATSGKKKPKAKNLSAPKTK